MPNESVYTDSFANAMIAIFLIVSALVALLWISVGGAALGPIMGVVFVGGLSLSTGLAMLVAYAFATVRRVKCDSSGFELTTGRVVGKSETCRFEWRTVTRAEVVASTVGAGRYRSEMIHLYVDVDGRHVELLRENRFSKVFRDLLKITSEMTPHLPYIWVHRKDSGARPVLKSAGSYRKVARR